MRSIVGIFVAAALVSSLATPVVRSLALTLGAVSTPGGRNVNARTVPRFGGIAICLAFLAAIGALCLSHSSLGDSLHPEARRLAALAAGGVVLCFVGAVDDIRRLKATHKLYAQLAVAVFAFAAGFRIDAVKLPLLGTWSMGVFAMPVTVFWIVGVTNAINLIDGLDGLAGGVVFFASLTNLVVAWVTGAFFVAATMSAVLGAVAGFLFFNFNPARIFMGDSGSYFLGFVLGTMSLVGSSQKASTAVSLLVPIVALGLPIVDTSFSLLRRFLEKRPLFSPDRGHIHHRLLDMGLTHRRAVLILYGVCVVLTAAAIGISLGRSWTTGVALLLASVAIIGVVRFVGYFEYLFRTKRQGARLRTRQTELLRHLTPQLPGLFAQARNESDVWTLFDRIVTRAGLSAAEVVAEGTLAPGPQFGRAPGAVPSGEIEAVSVGYPLGPDAQAVALLRFRWQSDTVEVSPDTEILLQVLVDMLAGTLLRVGSRFAPRRRTEAEERDRISTPLLTIESG
jgi:UDP-GlcNAc:undecaprenyl-phosphate GlcNAc-1-phosphate transferase